MRLEDRTKPCGFCGEPYSRPGYAEKQWARSRFCSQRCNASARWAGTTRPTKRCSRCGERYEKKPRSGAAKWGRSRFCSRDCRIAAMRVDRPVEVIAAEDVCRTEGCARRQLRDLGWCWHCYRGMPLADRLRGGVEKMPSGCWEWKRGRDKKGYGVMSIDNRSHHAHRIAWQVAKGRVPDGLFVLHRCDNPPCVNPDHLFLGTHEDNMADMDQKGRRYKGSAHHRTTLTEDDVRAMRALYAAGGMSYAEVGRLFGLTPAPARAAIVGQSWKSVEPAASGTSPWMAC